MIGRARCLSARPEVGTAHLDSARRTTASRTCRNNYSLAKAWRPLLDPRICFGINLKPRGRESGFLERFSTLIQLLRPRFSPGLWRALYDRLAGWNYLRLGIPSVIHSNALILSGVTTFKTESASSAGSSIAPPSEALHKDRKRQDSFPNAFTRTSKTSGR